MNDRMNVSSGLTVSRSLSDRFTLSQPLELASRFGVWPEADTIEDTLVEDDTPIYIHQLGETVDYMHLTKKRGRAGFAEDAEFSRGRTNQKIPRREVYDRQMRMADQIAAALNSVQGPLDPIYDRVGRLLEGLRRDAREHGLQLFGDIGKARNFLGSVSELLFYRTPATVVPHNEGRAFGYRINPA